MTLPVSSQVHYSPPIQQNEGTSIPSDSVKEYKLGLATIHDKIGSGLVTIRHWIDIDGTDCFQPFVHDCTLRNPFGPVTRSLCPRLKEEFCFAHSQDITFEMDGHDYIKVTEIDGNTTTIRYVDLQDKKKLDSSEGYGYNAYPYKPISITEAEVRSQIAKIPNLLFSSSGISYSSSAISHRVLNIRALFNSHGIVVHVLNESNYLITYCAAPGDTSLTVVPPNHVILPLQFDSGTAVWDDAHNQLMNCEGDLTTAQLNGDSAHYLFLDNFN